MKKKVLILNGQYLPGYKGGGPIQSCINMVEKFSEEVDFYVLCSDRDLNEIKPYPDIKIDKWNKMGDAYVFYMSPRMQSLKGFEEILNKTDFNLLYLNGFFSPIFTIKPLLLRRLRKLKETKIILTPRGDFTGGLSNKKFKKFTYICLVKLLGMYRNLYWHATSEIEEKDIKSIFPKAMVTMVPNLPAKFIPKQPVIFKNKGELRLLFISRIFPKKNIKYALEVLKQIKTGNVTFDIYGPMEDKVYWSQCEALIREMPINVKVKYCGAVPHSEIPKIFEQYHAFFFPTLGENYGHVIVEAMMNNCLCILSKGVTPWDEYINQLELGSDLKNQHKFVEIIEKLISIDNNQMEKYLEFTAEYISKTSESEGVLDSYRKLILQ